MEKITLIIIVILQFKIFRCIFAKTKIYYNEQKNFIKRIIFTSMCPWNSTEEL